MGLFFFKWIAEGPKCFRSHVFTHICRILRLNHLHLLRMKVKVFSDLISLHLQLFSTCPRLTFIFEQIWSSDSVSSQMLVVNVPQSYFLHFCMIFLFVLFVSGVFFGHEIRLYARKDMGDGTQMFVKWAMIWKTVKFEIKFWETHHLACFLDYTGGVRPGCMREQYP